MSKILGGRLNYLQHVPFEDPGQILVWAREHDWTVSSTHLYENDRLPQVNDFDFLVIMGGPMNIYEEKKHPWLMAEKRLIADAIEQGRAILGICLGAQLIADVLGTPVYKNKYREIGWFPVSMSAQAKESRNFSSFPESFMAFHWHGDIFDTPAGAVRTAFSEACPNQAFEFDGRVIGLQFHLESTSAGIEKLIRYCGNEITDDKFVQSANKMLSVTENVPKINQLMNSLLDTLTNQGRQES